MAKPYSDDFRQKVMQAIEMDGLKKSEASQLFNISRNTINLWFQRQAETGNVKPKPRRATQSQGKITDWEKFRAFVRLIWRSNASPTGSVVGWSQPAHDFTGIAEDRLYAQKKTYGYSQRDEERRAAFRAQIGDLKAPHLVYVDESGMDEREDYGYGYAPAGERLYALKSGRRQGRINMIAGYRNAQLIAPFTVEGACNRTVFETWLETCLIPVLRPGDWVIVDNATFHHGGRIAELIESAGCQLIYLPPYSPDLNRIEKCWATVKSRVRKQLHKSDTLRDAIEFVLKQVAS